MIVCVTEVYNGESPVTWICDTEKLDDSIDVCRKFKDLLESPFEGVDVIKYEDGWQDDDIANSEIKPPVTIEKIRILYEE